MDIFISSDRPWRIVPARVERHHWSVLMCDNDKTNMSQKAKGLWLEALDCAEGCPDRRRM